MSESNQNLSVVGAPVADESWRTEVALFRYTTILPLLRHNRDTDGSKKDIRAAIAARPHTIPHSPRTTISVPTLRHAVYFTAGENLPPGWVRGAQAQAPHRPRPVSRIF